MPDRTDTKLEDGFYEFSWAMASDTEASHWGKFCPKPEDMPATHEFRVWWEWSAKEKRWKLIGGTYPKPTIAAKEIAAIKAIGAGRLTPEEIEEARKAGPHLPIESKPAPLVDPVTGAIKPLEVKHITQGVPLTDVEKANDHVEAFKKLSNPDLHTKAAMLGVAAKDAKGKDRPRANIIAECAEKMAGKPASTNNPT